MDHESCFLGCSGEFTYLNTMFLQTLRVCKRYFPSLSVLLFVLTGVASGADTRPLGSQDWETIVKRAEEEGQVTVYATDSIGNAQLIWDAFRNVTRKSSLSAPQWEEEASLSKALC